MRALCHIFEQLPKSLKKTPFVVGPPTFLSAILHKCRSWWVLHACCYFMVGPRWLLLFPDGLWIVAVISCGSWMLPVISWWVLDASSYFLLGPGWLLLSPDALWIVAVILWWVLDVYCYFLMGPGWLLLLSDGLRIVPVTSCSVLGGYCYLQMFSHCTCPLLGWGAPLL